MLPVARVGVLAAAVVAGLVPAAAARAPRAEPLPYVEVVTGGAAADAELPLIVALHGRGDTAAAFATLFRDFPGRARVIVPRPPHPFGDGQAWFLGGWAHAESRPAIVAELLSFAGRVAATAESVRSSRPTRGRPVVMGFSQGGMLTWAIAVAQPRAFAAAFPVAGFLFPEMLETKRVDAATMPPVVAFHGDADPVVSIEADRKGVRLLEKRGVHVDLRVYGGLGHALSPALRDDLFAQISRALAR